MGTCPDCRTSYPGNVTTCPTDGSTLLPDAAFAHVERDLVAGATVGEYVVEAKIGEGGFGTVYRAVHPVIGKAAAIKVLSRQFSANPQMVSRFVAEARAANQVRHKNIIDVFAFGVLEDGRQYYVMELLAGRTFDDYVRARGRLFPGEALAILRGVARALDAAHKRGIIHRDLKPENVFLAVDEDRIITPKLLDFGIAKLTDGASDHKTKTGTPMGTPYYMSPEQARGRDVDHRTDVYAFGVMAFEVLTGAVPFAGDSAMDILLKQMGDEPPPLSSLVPELAPLDGALRRMLAKAPENRPSSVGEAFEAMVAVSGTVPDLAKMVDQPVIHIGSRSSTRPDAATVSAGGTGEASFAATRAPSSRAPSTVPSTRREGGPHAADASSAAPSITVSPTTVAPTGKRSGNAAIVGVVGVVALALGVGGVFALRGSKVPSGSQAAGTKESATLTSAPTSAPSAAPSLGAVGEGEAKEIKVTVVVGSSGAAVPEKATVWLGSKELGQAPGPFVVPRSTGTVTLVVKAVGFKPKTVDVDTERDASLVVSLDKAPKGPTLSKDLEPF